MIELEGHWYGGETSQQVAAWCRVDAQGAISVVSQADRRVLFSAHVFSAKVTPRLGDTPRFLAFGDGSKFETGDNDAVDELLAALNRTSKMTLVHMLETHKRYILASLVVLVLVVWVSVKWGFPGAAKFIAFQLPPSVVEFADQRTQEFIDKMLLGPSELDVDKKAQLIAIFTPTLKEFPDQKFKILFRKGGGFGPNALALPGGTIIFTDEMVELAKDDQELLAVLAHEMGHVVHRHSLRSIVQDSLLAFTALVITGDVSGASELFVGAPVLLAELAYSRDFERDADRFALEYMKAHGIKPIHFANLMRRVMKTHGLEDHGGERRWTTYLSTHPGMSERLIHYEEKD